MIDKGTIKLLYMEELEKKLKKAQSSYEVAKRDTIEAEGRMITRYDSSKTETAWLADGCLKEVKELEKRIQDVRSNKATVNINDKVYLDVYIDKKIVDEKSVLVSMDLKGSEGELFYSLLGLSVNDSVVIKEKSQMVEYTIKDIQKGAGEGIVGIDSLVKVQDSYGDVSLYYIVSNNGGMEAETDDGTVFFLSVQTPIAKAIIGSKKDDCLSVSINGFDDVLIIKDLN